MNFRIEEGTKEDYSIVLDGINDFNFSQSPKTIEPKYPIFLFAKNVQNSIIGGVYGSLGYYAGLQIHTLWVADYFRKQGVGKALMLEIEAIGKQSGAIKVILDTFTFQAEDFYKKLGYQEFGRIKNFPQGHDWVYFFKDL